MGMVDNIVEINLTSLNTQISNALNSDVVLYFGAIDFFTPDYFSNALANFLQKKDTLSIILQTVGGPVEPVERTVERIRNIYKYVNFIIPDYAMSAGTIFCMAGDKIYMRPESSLGPIDPQVRKPDGTYVPALGYLEQLAKFIKKSKDKTISPAEIDLLRQLNLADLNLYEQAKNLTITLLKRWLVQYKFKDWDQHQTSPTKKGKPVTQKEKELRAKEIAEKLGDISIWHSHARHINLATLRKTLRLEIEDYSLDAQLNQHINMFHALAMDYIQKNGYSLYVRAQNPTLIFRR